VEKTAVLQAVSEEEDNGNNLCGAAMAMIKAGRKK